MTGRWYCLFVSVRVIGLSTLCACAAFTMMLFPTGVNATLTVGGTSNVSENSGSSTQPQIAISDNGNIYLTWIDDTDFPLDTFFASSIDGGENINGPINLTEDSLISDTPKIAASGNNVYVVWSGSSFGIPGEIFFASGTIDGDGNMAFSSPINVSDTIDGSSRNPRIAASGDNVYVVWEDDIDGSILSEILYSNSTDGGQNFGTPINLSNNEGESTNAVVTISDSGNLYVGWQDDTPDTGAIRAIFLIASTDGGITFGGSANISVADGEASLSKIAAAGLDNVYLLWDDGTADIDVFFASAVIDPDAQINFSDPINVSSNSGSSSMSQFAMSDSGTIYVVWVDDIFGSQQVIITNSSNQGATFSEAVPISEDTGNAQFPKIDVVGDENIFLAWRDSSLGSGDVLFAASTDGGQSFETPVNLSGNSGNSNRPELAALGENIYVTWSDLSEGNSEIFFNAISNSVEPPSIEITSANDTDPKWGRFIQVSGTSNGADTDSITIDWGDGSSTPNVLLDGNTWGPVSHGYNSSNVGINQVTARLLDSEGFEKTISSPFDVTVLKHETILTLDPILSVLEGEDIVVTGQLVDADDDMGISGVTISFEGDGGEGLSNATTDSDGQYSSQGSSPNSAGTLWIVQAIFDGDSAYTGSGSTTKTFDTASLSADQFAVSTGSPSHIELVGYNASIDFDDVLSDGTIFVTTCETPDDQRYLSIDLCLNISSSLDMAPNSFAHVTVSYIDKTIPIGHSAKEIDMFHEGLAGFIDITESKDLQEGAVTGRTMNFSRFVVSIAVHETPDEDIIRKEVLAGEDRSVIFNDVESKAITFDGTKYSIGSSVRATIIDEDANLDSSMIETVEANVTSSSDPVGLTLILTETGGDTGVFVGSFTLSTSQSSNEEAILHVGDGDNIAGSYLAAESARFEVIFEDVSEAGIVELKKVVVNSTAGINFPEFDPIGDAYELRLVDAQLAASSQITIIMSYSNVELTEDYSPSLFRILETELEQPDPPTTEWVDITSIDLQSGNPAINISEETLTGTTSFLTRFSIGHNVREFIPGGSGGGLPRPGTGILLDAIAVIPATSDDSERHVSGGGGGSSTSIQQISVGNDIEASTKVGDETITIKFETVEPGSGQLRIESMSLSELDEILDDIVIEGGEEYGMVNLEGAKYETFGTVFNIDGSDVRFDGEAVVTMAYNENLALSVGSESSVRFLHYDENRKVWEDLTISIDTQSNTVTGVLSSLSPVVVAVVNDGTFGNAYFDMNPLSRVKVDNHSDFALDGRVEEKIVIPMTLKNVQRSSQQFIVLVQVLDGEGIVRYLDSQVGSFARGQSSLLSSSWIAEREGSYTAQIFVWDSFDHPSALSQVTSLKIAVGN